MTPGLALRPSCQTTKKFVPSNATSGDVPADTRKPPGSSTLPAMPTRAAPTGEPVVQVTRTVPPPNATAGGSDSCAPDAIVKLPGVRMFPRGVTLVPITAPPGPSQVTSRFVPSLAIAGKPFGPGPATLDT